MATIIVGVRGSRQYVNQWEETLNSVFLPYETEIIDPKTGKRLIQPLQLGVRPLRLYEVTYPKQQEDLVLKIVNPGTSWTAKYQKYFNLLRKLLGLQEIPKYEPQQMPHHTFVEVVGIGRKDDKERNGVELL